jgi:hypothetical protein
LVIGQIVYAQRAKVKMAKKETLDWNQQVLSRLGVIEHKVDSLEQTTAFALRADADRHHETVKQIFRHSIRKAQVYLAADGTRGVKEVAAHLHMQRQNITPELKKLQDEGLLEIVATSGGKDLWGKKPVDQSLRITQFLCKEFGLERNGLRLRTGRAQKGRHRGKS